MNEQQGIDQGVGDVQDRPAPQDLSAEKAVLSCIFQENEQYHAARQVIESGDFDNVTHKRLFHFLGRLIDAGEPADSVTVTAALKQAGALGADGAGLIAEISGDREVPSRVGDYAAIVRRKADLRKVISLGRQAVMLAQVETADPAQILQDLAEQVQRIESGAGGSNLLPEPLTGKAWEQDVPPREWLVDGWLPVGELSMLTGPGETGKSVLLLQMAAALACDRDALNGGGGWLPGTGGKDVPALVSDPATVVYANWEDSAAEFLRRRQRLSKEGGVQWAADPSINDRLHSLPMRGRGPVWGPGGSSGHIQTVGKLKPTGRALRRYCERVGARLLVLDPASLAFSIEENSRPLVSLALEDWAGWAMETGCAVMLTGHPAKTNEGEGADYSGTTAWRGLVRALWTLRKPSDKDFDAGAIQQAEDNDGVERLAVWTLNKANYALSGQVQTLRSVGRRAAWNRIEGLPKPKTQTGGNKGNEQAQTPKNHNF